MIFFYILLFIALVKEVIRVILLGFTTDTLLVFVFFGVLGFLLFRGTSEEKEQRDKAWRIFSNYLRYALSVPLFTLVSSLLRLSSSVMIGVEGLSVLFLLILFVFLFNEYKKQSISFRYVLFSVFIFSVFLQCVKLVVGLLVPNPSVTIPLQDVMGLLNLLDEYHISLP